MYNILSNNYSHQINIEQPNMEELNDSNHSKNCENHQLVQSIKSHTQIILSNHENSLQPSPSPKIKLSLYNENGMKRIKSHMEYINSHPNQGIYASIYILVGVYLGYQIAPEIVETFEQLIIKRDSEENTGTGWLSRTIGGIVGAVGGAYGYIMQTEQQSEFNQWIDKGTKKLVQEKIDALYSEDPVLQTLICPIEYCPLKNPVRSPYGTVYEASTLLQKAKRDSVGYIIDFYRNPSFSETLILKDHELELVTYKRYLHLLRSDFEKSKDGEEVAQSLQFCIKVIEEIVFVHYEAARLHIEELRINGRVSHLQYKNEIDTFENLFGNTYLDELNWKLNWSDELDNRWNHFHPRP